MKYNINICIFLIPVYGTILHSYKVHIESSVSLGATAYTVSYQYYKNTLRSLENCIKQVLHQ